jgi:DNA-binding Lrp family transcriptional regulator
VLIKANPEKEYQIFNHLSNESEIVELRPLFREYDLIARIKTESKKQLGIFISDKIKSLEGVIDTKTL